MQAKSCKRLCTEIAIVMFENLVLRATVIRKTNCLIRLVCLSFWILVVFSSNSETFQILKKASFLAFKVLELRDLFELNGVFCLCICE